MLKQEEVKNVKVKASPAQKRAPPRKRDVKASFKVDIIPDVPPIDPQ
jgi:hypothetical protein